MSNGIKPTEPRSVLSKQHWRQADYKQRITATQWRKILLANDDNIIFKGSIVPLIARNIGYGVVEVSKKMEE